MAMRMSNLSHRSNASGNHNISGTHKKGYKQYQTTYQPDTLSEEENHLQEQDNIDVLHEIHSEEAREHSPEIE